MALLGYKVGTDGGQPLTANGGIPIGALFTSTAAGTAYASSTTPTNVEPALAPVPGFTSTAGTIPAGFLNFVGKAFRVKAHGIIANTATPNLTFAVLLGTTAVATTGAQATAAITGTATWNLEVSGVVTATGAAGTVMTFGYFQYQTTGPTVSVTWKVSNATAGTADAVDLTVAQAVHVQATWGTNSASNTLTCSFLSFEFLN